MILLMKNSKFLVVVELQYKLEVENPSFLMQKVLFCETLWCFDLIWFDSPMRWSLIHCLDRQTESTIQINERKMCFRQKKKNHNPHFALLINECKERNDCFRLLLIKSVYDYWSQSSHAVCVRLDNLTNGSCPVNLQSISSCLFVHWQKTCVMWRCVGIQWMIRFAFLASQVYIRCMRSKLGTQSPHSFLVFFLHIG